MNDSANNEVVNEHHESDTDDEHEPNIEDDASHETRTTEDHIDDTSVDDNGYNLR